MSIAFAQTGTVDWASLTSMTISAPITLMSRLAQAGVDQYTIELVKFYGQFLNLPSDYLSVVETGLMQARRFGFSADILYIGAGISLIPPMLAKTRGGVAFAAVTMALRASFPAEFTARVLSEWLRFFERPPEISIPSTSQLQALSNEIAACPIDPEIGRIIWGVERLQKNAVGAALSYSGQFTAPPPAQDLAAAIYAITTIRSGQDAIIRFKSAQGPSPVWLAAFASKVLGLGVSYEIGTQVIWEQPQKYCAISGPRGHLRLVTETSLDRSNHTNNYQLLKAASIELNLQRQETNVETSFRISPSLVVDRILGGLFNDPRRKNDAIQCIAKAAYHLSQKFAVWSVPGSRITQFTPMRNGIKAALLMIGVNPCDLDMLEAEAEAETQESNTGRDALGTYTFEEDLQDLFGAPFILLFKKIHAENHQSFSNEQNTWSHRCLDTFQRVLALWAVLSFTSTIGQDSVSLDGRAVYRIIEKSNGFFSAFQFIWPKVYYKQQAQEIHYISNVTCTLSNPEEVLLSHFLQISAVHEIAFDIIGGRFNPNHSSNINTAGIASGGSFVVMSTLLEPSPQCPKEAAIIFVGQGGIFVNQQAVSFLQSFDPGDSVSPQNLTISPELKNSSYEQLVRRYNPDAKSFEDLTQTHLNMKLYMTGGFDIVSIAWSLSGRHGPDVMIDALLSPHQILKAILNIQFIDRLGRLNEMALSDVRVGLPKVSEQRDMHVINVETFLAMPRQKPNRNQLIMTRNNSHAKLLAMTYWCYWGSCLSITSDKVFTDGLIYLCPPEQLVNLLPRMPENSTIIIS